MLRINETIPEGLIYDSYYQGDIRKIDLNEYNGKWIILLFYPGDFTFVCPTELGDFSNLYGEFKKEGAEIFSVSTDSAYTHKAWHDSSPIIKNIIFPMIADPTGNLAKLFGTYIDEEGVSLRGTFIIDPDGVLKAYELHDNSIGRAASESLRKLQAAKFVREHGGEVCPANWKPGQKTLRPSVELVGKI